MENCKPKPTFADNELVALVLSGKDILYFEVLVRDQELLNLYITKIKIKIKIEYMAL